MVDYIPLLRTKPTLSSDIDEWGPSPSSTRTQSTTSMCRFCCGTQPNFCSADSENRKLWLIFLGCVISIGTVLFNIAHARQSFAVTVVPPNKLKYPNPYIGLENAILEDVALPAPILNFPLLLAQINMSDRSVAYEDLHPWSSDFGMIYPEDRTFLVSSEVCHVVWG